MAILDADKEGFLRSDRSLIQTIGRAARNVNGRAILYADKITGSMDRAIKETERRRTKQIAHNKKHGIVPKSVKKSVADILEGAVTPGRKKGAKARVVEEPKADYAVNLTPEAMAKEIRALEEKMMEHARNLEFEEAARLRDQISRLRDRVLIPHS